MLGVVNYVHYFGEGNRENCAKEHKTLIRYLIDMSVMTWENLIDIAGVFVLKKALDFPLAHIMAYHM